jgi:hypothetical protein
MDAAWAMAPMLFDIDGLADLLGERHRIFANDWQAAAIMSLAGRILSRACNCSIASTSARPRCARTSATSESQHDKSRRLAR